MINQYIITEVILNLSLYILTNFIYQYIFKIELSLSFYINYKINVLNNNNILKFILNILHLFMYIILYISAAIWLLLDSSKKVLAVINHL